MGQRSSHGNLESVKGRINITNLKSETNGSKQQGFTMSNLSIAQKRAAASLRCMFVGDSLAMPVHWYYNPMDIFKQFSGGITKLEAAPKYHPSSIMSLHSTKRGGRDAKRPSSSQPEIVGDVILKGKRQFWNQPNQHYHQGMLAGENTLNSHCARIIMRALGSNGGHYNEEQFLNAYIELMTANPALHPDTYAESYHRGFFANLSAGKPHNKCGAVTHDTASMGGLVTIAPIMISERLLGTPLEDVQTICHKHIQLTHPDEFLAKVCSDYIGLLDALLFSLDAQRPQEIIATWAKRSIGITMPELLGKVHSDNDVVGRLFSSACYISDSWPSVLYLAYKYADKPVAGLLANTNLGGDNAHRGSVLGVILGLASGFTPSALYDELQDKDLIEEEISALLN
jgi:ADP-ribosylglycohydrolase|tara:strand:+ start:5266 stop:6462 length:1197 start_codon:yes stop_codon:yes gene_type:complete